MADKLLIHIKPHEPDKAHWLSINSQGQPSSDVTHGSLADISADKSTRAIVLLDSSCISVDMVAIPGNNRQRQLQAVPFALEEALASDIDELYFAIGNKQADGKLPVITINKNLFESLLAEFQQKEIFTEMMSADLLALPLENNSWSLLVDGNSVLVKTGPASGFYCDRDNAAIMLELQLKQSAQQPESITLYHAENDSHAAELLTELNISFTTKTYSSSLLEILASNFADASQLNMLQGKYAPRRKGSALLKPWKAVAALFASWLVVQLVYAGLQINQLQTSNQELTAQLEKEFKRAMPGARKFNNMQKRMERKLKELKGGSGDDQDDNFMHLLSASIPSINNKQIQIHGMVYNNKRIDMELQANSLQTLESMKSSLAANKSIKATLSTSIEKDKVIGRLRLERQG